jgi:hypothetical protein
VESILGYGAAMKVELVRRFHELLRPETELWNLAEFRVQQGHGVEP